MKRLKLFGFYFSVVALVLMLPVIASAEVAGQIAGQLAGKMTKVEGRVDLLKAGAAAAVPVKVNDAVSIGDIVRTKSDGVAEITLSDKSVLTVGPKSRLAIEEHLFSPDSDKRVTSVKLQRGKMGFEVPKPVYTASGSKFEMKTKTAIAGVRGTSGLLLTGNVDRTFVKTGRVEFKTALGSVIVNAGQVGEAIAGKAPTVRPFSQSEFQKQEGGVKSGRSSEKKSEGESKQEGGTASSGGGTTSSSESASASEPPPPPPPAASTTSALSTITSVAPPPIDIPKPPPIPADQATGASTSTKVNISIIHP